MSFPLSSDGIYPLWDKIAVVPSGLGFSAGICRTKRHKHTSKIANTNDFPGLSSPLSSPSPSKSTCRVSLLSSCAGAISVIK